MHSGNPPISDDDISDEDDVDEDSYVDDSTSRKPSQDWNSPRLTKETTQESKAPANNRKIVSPSKV